jgi:hypothetical protein
MTLSSQSDTERTAAWRALLAAQRELARLGYRVAIVATAAGTFVGGDDGA